MSYFDDYELEEAISGCISRAKDEITEAYVYFEELRKRLRKKEQ